MKIKGNLLIFSSDNEDRTDVRKLKEKRLQVLLDEKNDLPSFEINNTEYAFYYNGFMVSNDWYSGCL